ncbi:MAG: nucleotidyltransferase domain-containing protein [bacterium]|nr:nucleotidyltransferase domain-containing protein [bacterium]
MKWLRKEINLQKAIPFLVEKMKNVINDQIHSLILFGSVVKGNWNPEHSDINLICEFKDKQLDVLDYAISLKKDFQEYRVNCLWFGFGALLKSADVFPIEMLDLKLYHELLYGEDLLKDIQINKKDLRLACERIAREKLLSLRTEYLNVAGNEKAIRSLLIKSSPTWGAEFQAILYLMDEDIPQDLKLRARKVGELLNINSAAFEALFEWRNNPKTGDLVFLMHILREYLNGVQELVNHLDKLEVK